MSAGQITVYALASGGLALLLGFATLAYLRADLAILLTGFAFCG